MHQPPFVAGWVCFVFNDTATTEIYTLSLHDALPISLDAQVAVVVRARVARADCPAPAADRDRKSTRLNSSHDQISYAVFCLKKKKTRQYTLKEAAARTGISVQLVRAWERFYVVGEPPRSASGSRMYHVRALARFQAPRPH